MNRLPVIFGLICLGFSLHGVGQEENWDTYLVKMGNMPASVMVDMGAKEGAPDTRYPFLVTTGPKTRNCNTLGIPDKDEINVLEDILDATTNFITGLTPRKLVGTVTKNCQRVNYYYVKDTTGIRIALARMYTRSFKDYAYVLSLKADPGWTIYKSYLYPDEETRNWMDNDKKVTKMLQAGDSIQSIHHLRFSLLFRTEADRDSFLVYAAGKGYKSLKARSAESPYTPFEAVLNVETKLVLDEINAKSFDIKLQARKRNGFYNGWVIQ